MRHKTLVAIIILTLIAYTAIATTVELTVDTSINWIDNHTFEIKVSGEQSLRIDCDYPKNNGKLYAKIPYDNINLYPEVLLEWKDNTTYNLKIKDTTYEDNCNNYPNNRQYQTKINWEILENEDKKTTTLEAIQATAKETECRVNLENCDKERNDCKPKLETCTTDKAMCQGEINTYKNASTTIQGAPENATCQELLTSTQAQLQYSNTEKNSYQTEYQKLYGEHEKSKQRRTQEWLISIAMGILAATWYFKKQKPGIGGNFGTEIWKLDSPGGGLTW